MNDNIKLGAGVGTLNRDETTGDIRITGMTVTAAIESLLKLAEQDEKVVGIHHEFPEMFVTEGMVAFADTLIDRYGRVFTEGVGSTMVAVEIGPGVTRQVVWGKFGIPGMEGSQLATSMTLALLPNGQKTPIFVLSGNVKQKYKAEIDALAAAIRQWGKDNSIYKGRPVELRFPDIEKTKNPLDFAPKFMEIDPGAVAAPVFDDETQAIIDNYIYEDIEATDLTRENGMSIKKGILLEGPPGVGKTLLAHAIAAKCKVNGWTFCYLKNPAQIAGAVALVQQTGWGPAFIFAEDVDRVVGMERTDAVNEVLNVIDGIDGKVSDIVVLFTTNEIDVIHKTMLRPGRLDILISVHAPDAETVERLIRREAGVALDPYADLSEVGVELAGTMPAVVVQVVSRAKRAAQRRNRLDGIRRPLAAFPGCISPADLLMAARSMKAHIDRLKPVPQDDRTPIEKAASVLGDAFKFAATYDPYAETEPEPTSSRGLLNGNGQVATNAPAPRRRLGSGYGTTASPAGSKKTE